MAKPDQMYLDKLLLYYEEEIEGEAYFAELARTFPVPDQKAKLTLLAEVEAHAARAVEPVVAKYGLTPRATGALVESGRAQARATMADWAGLLAEMNRTYPGYLDAFRSLEAMAPPEDRPRLSILTAHEEAAMRFLEIEAERPQDSAAPLEAYLATDLVISG